MIITCAFTREWAVDQWMQCLAKVDYNRSETDLAFIVDTFSYKILDKLKTLSTTHRHVKIVINEYHKPNEVRPAERRKRIAEIKNQSREIVDSLEGDVVIGFEDDTVFDMPNFDRLTDPLTTDQIGFVEGVQCGRWGVKMVGVWEFDDLENPSVVKTLMPGDGYQTITAGGMYGYATRKRLYVDAEYGWEPWQPWGPDVNYGLYVNQQGFECVVDWSTKFGHNDSGRILYPDENVSYVQFEKRDTQWVRTDGTPENYNPT